MHSAGRHQSQARAGQAYAARRSFFLYWRPARPAGNAWTGTRITRDKGHSLDELKMGQGQILRLDGKKVAAYRAEDGKVTLCSPVCTHLKCIVRWNAADKTWDCPCHGSRFKPTGEVFSGPAEVPLEKISWPGKS